MVVVPALGRYSCLRGQQWPRSGGVARKTRMTLSRRARELDLGWDNALEGACCRHLLIDTKDLLQRALALLPLPAGSAKHLAKLCTVNKFEDAGEGEGAKREKLRLLVLMTRMSQVTDIALLKYLGAGYFDDGVSGNQELSVNRLQANYPF
ncbi:uncharacterized protein BJ212DRAFT_1588520 [Suillus subaureus]|uniref:Uncharacterized protein n=1 Tax=Suillus subaureus TaxID=48587 RepID=A0A9P7E842_9AGAM|nr:uncharacterized protein BJ212DRAFT_1588520 [Suillus subaureus]KAG1813974.1 hypothetical protein BJ212DRAFT_1588520 [Suillus subaureus]